jgi:hypothetical protein
VRPEEDRDERTGTCVRSELAELVYELLDAHDDTASLAAGLGDIAWLIHLDYLRALQRRGRELLARLALEDSPP